MHPKALSDALDELLQASTLSDYCPNGWQFEGKTEVKKLVSGVTASLALIEAAAERGADALLVHHGFFWRGEDPRVLGQKFKRFAALMRAGLNLFAYHLPLDVHPTLGNNAQLGRVLGFTQSRLGGERGLIAFGRAEHSVDSLSSHIARVLNREPLVVGQVDADCSQLAWCTGGAQGYIEQAYAEGARVFISGEISEQTTHFAREMGMAYIACGHHASERYGVQAVGRAIATRYGLTHEFVDIDNPA